MIDDTQTPGSGPEETGGETSMGGTSEWSTVPSASEPPEPVPAQALEPLPPAPQPPLEPLPAPASTPPGNPAAPPAGYQPVYGTQPNTPPPPGYTSAPGQGPNPNYPPPPQGPPPGYGGGSGYPPPAAGQGLSSHAAAAIAYITFIPAVLFLVLEPYNRDRFVRFHAWQCIALTIVGVAITILFHIVGMVSFHLLWWLFLLISLAVRLILFVFWLIALIKASQGQWYKIPIVGDLAQNLAGSSM